MHGIPTYAGCLTEQAKEILKNESKQFAQSLIPLCLDVRNNSSVREAFRFLENDLVKRNENLWALVNNAGIPGEPGPDVWMTICDYEKVIDTNLLGMIRCTHACLHLLKKSKGRIVSVASIAGRFAIPYDIPYSVSKFGVEAYMDALRRELDEYGVTCSIIEPGIFRTSITDSERIRHQIYTKWNELPDTIREEYGEEYKHRFISHVTTHMEQNASDRVDWVVDAYFHAITARYPRLRYRCGWDSLIVFTLLSILPTGLGDAVYKTLAHGNGRLIPAVLIKKK
ncbi:short chain dehydrogenase domain-containing protein [Ditylenchus destructor]|nr:short chain dehydrogenase domain-containing protein [Ditylenchus destructor]